jgi:hypothetical protein
MPYIEDQVIRDSLDKLIDDNDGILTANGNLNYFLFALCKRTVKPSYNNYKNFLGELAECSAEIRRRLLAPYEDKKINENGDVD